MENTNKELHHLENPSLSEGETSVMLKKRNKELRLEKRRINLENERLQRELDWINNQNKAFMSKILMHGPDVAQKPDSPQPDDTEPCCSTSSNKKQTTKRRSKQHKLDRAKNVISASQCSDES